MQKLSYLFPLLCFLVIGAVIAPKQKPILNVSKQESALNLATEIYQYFTFGQRRISADILWIQTLLESDLEHYKQKDLNSWMFHRFHNISILDPKFIHNYWFGGQYLSVIKDDDLGAEKIYTKGLSLYPDDVHLNFYLGAHYINELDEPAKAIPLYEKVIASGRAPFYLPSLVARLKAGEGGLQESFQIIKDLYESSPKDSPLRERYYNQLYAIKAEIDLNCLNKDKSNCNIKDLNGNNYYKEENIYKASIEWKPFRVKKQGKY